MNCFDCSASNTESRAVAVCVNCGAGICYAHARQETRLLSHPAGVGRRSADQTRALTCENCDRVLTHQRAETAAGSLLV